MPMSAPVLSPAKVPVIKAGTCVLGICGAIGLLIAWFLGAGADGAAPQNVAHLYAFLGLGGAVALIAWAAGIPGIYPPRFDRLALVTNWLKVGAAVQIFFTKPVLGQVRRARRRAWRMKP